MLIMKTNFKYFCESVYGVVSQNEFYSECGLIVTAIGPELQFGKLGA